MLPTNRLESYGNLVQSWQISLIEMYEKNQSKMNMKNI